VRALVLLVPAACAKEPAKKPPPPPPAVEIAPAPAIPACDDASLQACTVAVETLDHGAGLTVTMTETATQGTDPGETFAEPYWDCDVYVIGAAKVVHATHHDRDLHFDLAPGPYVVRFDSCFSCRKDATLTVTRGSASVVHASCHITGA
jgi:hypothetical protein